MSLGPCRADNVSGDDLQMGMITRLLLKRKIPAQEIMPDSERTKDFKTVAVRNLYERGMVI